MSSPATRPNADLDWKQEVNKRLAAHKSRKESAAGDRAVPALSQHGTNTRAAQAAARVAARYANVPSYNQILADEARAAVRAAEAASHAALKMQAAAESVLAELEFAVEAEAPRVQQETLQSQPVASDTFFDSFLEVERPVAAAEQPAPTGELEIRWESDLPVRRSQAAASRASRRAEQFALTLDDWRGSGSAPTYGEPETVEPAQPIHANLIEFPRELIAARKARPRIAEGPLAPEGDEPGQLSIFEVDPGTICIEPAPADVAVETHPSGWSKLRLDKEAVAEPAAESAAHPRTHPIELAPLQLRGLAAVVDLALIGAVFSAVAMTVAANLSSQPSMKSMEIAAGAAFFAIGMGYQAFFFLLAGLTPGMRYAGISLCNFEDEMPSREQLRRRVAAMVLSLLPVGLGVLWAIFDEDHLSWHDRISRTYTRCG